MASFLIEEVRRHERRVKRDAPRVVLASDFDRAVARTIGGEACAARATDWPGEELVVAVGAVINGFGFEHAANLTAEDKEGSCHVRVAIN